jgi:hypothetical protein
MKTDGVNHLAPNRFMLEFAALTRELGKPGDVGHAPAHAKAAAHA